MRKLVGICPACEKKSKFAVLTVVTETRESTIHFCQCLECMSQVYVATLRIVPSDYKPILTKGVSVEDGDSSPHGSAPSVEDF